MSTSFLYHAFGLPTCPAGRQAYGYRDQEFFKLRILGIHEAKYALTG